MLYSTTTDALFSHFDEDTALDMFKDAGFPALDFSMFTSERVKAEGYREYATQLRKKANERGIIFNQMHAPFGGGKEFYLTDTFPVLPRCLELASLLGVKNMVIHPITDPRYYGHEEEHFEMNMKFYRALAPYAKEYGVKIAIENMWELHPIHRGIVDSDCADPYEHIRYFDTLDDGEAFTLCLDLGHVALCGREPEESIRILGHDRLGVIHAHDVDYRSDLHTLPGVSLLNWEGICKALGEINYKGDFTLEADGFYRHLPKAVYPEACRLMGAVCRDMVRQIEENRVK